MIYDTMSKAEIDHTRNTFSKSANGKAWKDSYGEMAKKTVLRRLCKLIDLNFDTIEQKKAFEDGSLMEVKKENKEPEKGVNPFEDIEEPLGEAVEIEVEDASNE